MRSIPRILHATLVYLMVAALLIPAAGHAAIPDKPVTTFGTVTDLRSTELAPGAVYTWYDLQIPRGPEKAHFVAFDPRNSNLELRAGTKSGKVYGMQGVTQMAAYADKPGSRVIAGVNGDFYDLTGYSTGVPNGLFMDDGRILNSSSSTYAFGLKADGTSIYGTPQLTKTVTIGGKTMNLTHINRYRENNQLVLYSSDYSDSTKTTNLGDEIVLDIEQGEIKSGQTVKLKVSEVRKDQGDTPLISGKMVLSASGTARQLVAGLQIGDVVTASFSLSGEWQDVKTAIGGQGPLLKDGVVQPVGPAGVHPRTAIGTKADGTVVLFEIDGRAPGFSEGVETNELALILKDLGVVNAMNLDGGGSSTFVARMPGTTGVKMLNRGSDGGERSTGNSLLLVNKAPEGPAAKLIVQPNMERVLAGSSIMLKTVGVDAGGHPASVDEAPQWQADPAIGTVDANGVFNAANTAAAGVVTATAGALQGTGDIEVVDQITALKMPDAIKTFTSGATSSLTVTALRDGQVIQASNRSFEWRVEGPIGTIDANGVFTATQQNGQSGTIYVKYGDIETSMEVNVGLPPVGLEDFENGIGNYMASGAAYNSVTIAAESDPDFVRSGSGALKLSYDFVGKTGTSGAYLSARSAAMRIQVPGYPESIGMWVYGDGKKHWLRAQMRDGNGAAFAIDFTDSATGVNWTGWKYVEAPIPKGKAAPLTMDLPVRYMETSNTNKTSGALYIDQIRAVYGPLQEDRTPPEISNVRPAEDGIVTSATPDIRAIAADSGYDPVQHPGTTLIDPNSIRLYVDGVKVTHGLYPPEGRITYKPAVPLDDGVHTVKLAVRDLSGNQTIKQWRFSVDTGAPKLKYETPAEIYAGRSYTVDIKGGQAERLQGGHLELQFDPALVTGLAVRKGGKLQEDMIQHQIDPATGIVRVTFSSLSGAGLTVSDLLAQIEYRVKGSASGTNSIGFRSASVLLTDASTPKNYIGLPLQSEIKHELRLSWDDSIGQGMSTAFTITDASGSPIQGAGLIADGSPVGDGTLLTDAQGQLTTNVLTSEVRTYQLQAVQGERYSPVVAFKVSNLAGTPIPNNISVAMGADPSVSRGFSWHTHPATESTVVEIAKADGFTGFDQPGVQRVEGESYNYNTLDIGTVRVHKATAEGLDPGTAYVYRVGDGAGSYSPQGTFTTAPQSGEQTKFLVFGDSQAADQVGFDKWGATVAKAFSEHPDASFMVHVGDMVDNGFKEQEWKWWFEKAQQYLLQTTLLSVVGNHEVTGTKGNGDFLAHFNHPQNGLDSLKGSQYSFDYNNIHFVVLNSEYEYEAQKEWLRTDLANTDQRWKVIFFHRGPYGSIYDTAEVRSQWTPVFDEFGVDLVMNGHDHIYLRTHAMRNNEPAEDGKGTTYVIPGATGPKFYELTPRPWQKVTDDENTQMYTAVKVEGSLLQVVTKTVGGRVVDSFELQKPISPRTIALDAEKMELEVGESTAVKAMVDPVEADDKTVTWTVQSSSVEGAVTVAPDGTVTAHKPGTAVVRATSVMAPEVFGEVEIRVKDRMTGIALMLPDGLRDGDKAQAVTEAVYLSGLRVPLSEHVTYTSSNPKTAVIDNAGVITAVKEGETLITASFEGVKAEGTLTISKKRSLVKLEAGGLEGSLNVGDSREISVTAHYSDKSSEVVTAGVTFASDSPNVAEIDDQGVLLAVANGHAVITIQYKGKRETISIWVGKQETGE